MKKRYPYYLANQPQRPNFALEVLDKYTGETAARVAYADAASGDALDARLHDGRLRLRVETREPNP